MKFARRNCPEILIIFLIFLFLPSFIVKYEFPVYRVVLDPGHGGRQMLPRSEHGDRYDKVTERYLDTYRPGASYGGRLHEHLIVFSIAEKVENLLSHCSPEGDFGKFYEILKKYTDEEVPRIYIQTKMSRDPSLTDKEAKTLEDPNALYRLFDYPDENGKIQPGRISRINAFKPHMVLSLHAAHSAPRDYKGMTPVLAPSYDFMYKGLQYLRKEHNDRTFFHNSPERDWFTQDTSRSHFQWFLSDTSLYFTGFPLNRDLSVNTNNFRGYRHNMIQWSYADDPGWHKTASKHPDNTRYSSDYNTFKPVGKFWEREQNKFEKQKRSGGIEGSGGDNAFSSYEIIRYIMYALDMHDIKHPNQKPGKPFICIWTLPIHLNAINPFIELGYLARKNDRYLLTEKQDEIAEGIAVGIYSLFAGLKVGNEDFQYKPKGDKIDIEKYTISKDKTYFDVVTD